MHTLDKSLISVVKSLKASYGADFFNNLTLQLNRLIQADYTFIAKLNHQDFTSHTISLAAKGKIAENFSYELAHTPCADVSKDSVCVYPKKICHLYPKDQLLIDMNIEGYIGTPLYDSNGGVIGLVVALYEHEIEDGSYVTALFELFSGRISAEIERENKEKELLALNTNLESKVYERTSELSQAIDALRATQNKLIEQEKMASLGNLVAGVAHEINTPLGVAILSSSNIEDALAKLQQKIASNTLTRNGLERCIDLASSSQETLHFNLQRSAQLVDSFKEMAVDKRIEQLSSIDVTSWLAMLTKGLKPMFEEKNIRVNINSVSIPFSFKTSATKLTQVVTNILSNSVLHAFESDRHSSQKQINISIHYDNEKLHLSIKDNGCGMSEVVKENIFEPFYTTKRGSGGTGLGLNIVKNIVENSLCGDIEIDSTLGKGSCVSIILPSLA